MEKLKIGIIGAGSIVESNHLPAIKTLKDVEVSWIYDKNSRRMDLLSTMYGISLLDKSPAEEAFDQIDICLIAIPYGARQPYIDLCRNFKKSVIIEKPFAFSAAEHLGYCQGFEPWQIAINFQRKFYKSVVSLKSLISSNIFGSLQSIKFIQGNFALKGGAGYLSDVKLAGGGVIAESAIHALDIILYITKASQVELVQMHSLFKEGIDYDSIFDSVINSDANKINVHCEISTLRNFDNGLYLQFENSSAFCDLSPNGEITIFNEKNNKTGFSISEEPFFDQLGSATKINQAFFIFWQRALHAINNKIANETNACSSFLTSQWIEKIYSKINLH